jgi:hypothetical protein
MGGDSHEGSPRTVRVGEVADGPDSETGCDRPRFSTNEIAGQRVTRLLRCCQRDLEAAVRLSGENGVDGGRVAVDFDESEGARIGEGESAGG